MTNTRNLLRASALAFALSAGFASSAALAAQAAVKEAREAMDAGDYGNAYVLAHPKAVKGNVEAMGIAGYSAIVGLKMPAGAQRTEALRFLEAAANTQDELAMERMAILWYDGSEGLGDGLKNPSKAMAWIKKGADLGQSWAYLFAFNLKRTEPAHVKDFDSYWNASKSFCEQGKIKVCEARMMHLALTDQKRAILNSVFPEILMRPPVAFDDLAEATRVRRDAWGWAVLATFDKDAFTDPYGGARMRAALNLVMGKSYEYSVAYPQKQGLGHDCYSVTLSKQDWDSLKTAADEYHLTGACQLEKMPQEQREKALGLAAVYSFMAEAGFKRTNEVAARTGTTAPKQKR